MKVLIATLIFLLCFSDSIIAQRNDKRILSSVDTVGDYLTLRHEFVVNVPLDSVWHAYTSKEGWEGAFVAKATVDFKINGSILTTYDKNATIGDSTTIRLNVLNFIQKKMITLKADISGNFAAFTEEEAKDLYNVIWFEELSKSETRIVSYGLGYRNNEKFSRLMKFFIQGNEYSYKNLINYLENGIKVKF